MRLDNILQYFGRLIIIFNIIATFICFWKNIYLFFHKIANPI